MRDSLGDRMKEQYENRWRFMVPRRTYTLVRIDGKAFHSYTNKNCEKPFSDLFESAMDDAAQLVVREAQGQAWAFVQSDEISVLLTDFQRPETEAWFDGNLQKICSVSASMVTVGFNATAAFCGMQPSAVFDARVFVIPDPVEVENYFIWRQKDCERNSMSSLAQSKFSAKQLHGKSISQMHEMLCEKKIDWNSLPAHRKWGRIIKPNKIDRDIPVFTRERAFLTALVPRQWADVQKDS